MSASTSARPENENATTLAPAVRRTADYVTMVVAGQLFGIPVLEVHDVFSPSKLAFVPMAPLEVEGVLNLRGRIVTAIDLRLRFGYPARAADAKKMAVVIEHHGEPYSLLIDAVGEVLSLDEALCERNPVNLDPRWRDISEGVYRLDNELLVVLALHKIIKTSNGAMAA